MKNLRQVESVIICMPLIFGQSMLSFGQKENGNEDIQSCGLTFWSKSYYDWNYRHATSFCVINNPIYVLCKQNFSPG